MFHPRVASILQRWFILLAKVLSVTASGTSTLVAPMMPLASPFHWLGKGRDIEGWRNNGAPDRLLFWWPHVCCRLWNVAWKKSRGQAEHANRVIVAGFQRRPGSPLAPLISHCTHLSPSNLALQQRPSPLGLPRACRVILTSWFPNRTTNTPPPAPFCLITSQQYEGKESLYWQLQECRQNTSVNTAQLSHIKKSVLGPEAFDSFISAWIPEGPKCSCFHSARLFWRERGRQGGLSWQPYKVCCLKTSRVQRLRLQKKNRTTFCWPPLFTLNLTDNIFNLTLYPQYVMLPPVNDKFKFDKFLSHNLIQQQWSTPPEQKLATR